MTAQIYAKKSYTRDLKGKEDKILLKWQSGQRH